MRGRWLLLAFGLLFSTLTVVFALQGAWFRAAIALVHSIATLGGFWWTVTHEETTSTRWA